MKRVIITETQNGWHAEFEGDKDDNETPLEFIFTRRFSLISWLKKVLPANPLTITDAAGDNDD